MFPEGDEAPFRREMRRRGSVPGALGLGSSVPAAQFGAFVPASSHFLRSKQKIYDKSADYTDFDVKGLARFLGFTTKVPILPIMS